MFFILNCDYDFITKKYKISRMNTTTKTLLVATPAWRGRVDGLIFVCLLALAATQAAHTPALSAWGISPLVVAIVLGAAYTNLMPGSLPAGWAEGIHLAARRLLRIAVAFYGLRISVQALLGIGLPGLSVAVMMVLGTLGLGVLLGRVLRIDRETALLTAAGSAICGAAAVLAFESTTRAAAHKSTVAVATVVLFGTVSMFLVPVLYHAGWLPFSPVAMGVFIGATVHEVAQVVATASAIDPSVIQAATIVKMARVALLVPLLLILGAWLAWRPAQGGTAATAGRVAIPWFVLGFLALVLVNSSGVIPRPWLETVHALDTFALTMAMAALGLETRLARMREAGPRVLLLAFLLFAWLLVGGYWVTRWVMG